MCLRHLGKEDEAVQLLRRVYSRDAKFTPARQALDDPTRKLVLTNTEKPSRPAPTRGTPSTAPSAKQAEVAKHAEEAARYLAEGEAELDRMLGMAEAKRQVKLIRSTTKVNQARAKMGLPVSVTSRHTLLVGPPGCGKTTVARALTKQLCGLGVLRRPIGDRDQQVAAGRQASRRDRRTAPTSCSSPLWAARFSSTRCTTCTTRVTATATRTARR